MKIYAIRHGTTELNKKGQITGHLDIPLAKEGEIEASLLSDNLPKSITHMYVSPLIRTRQTAERVNALMQLPVSFHKEIKEVNFGSLDGKTWEEIEKQLQKSAKKVHRSLQYNYQIYGGESVQDVTKRVTHFLKQIQDTHKDYEVLLVTHGGIIRLLHFLQHNTPIAEVPNISLHEFDVSLILKNSQTPSKL